MNTGGFIRALCKVLGNLGKLVYEGDKKVVSFYMEDLVNWRCRLFFPRLRKDRFHEEYIRYRWRLSGSISIPFRSGNSFFLMRLFVYLTILPCRLLKFHFCRNDRNDSATDLVRVIEHGGRVFVVKMVINCSGCGQKALLELGDWLN